jgi:glycosyltransferase involved in cell wall biosynthesis
MSCQRAVVVSRRGSLPEVVLDGETGFVADPDDAAEFTGKLSKLLEDSDLRRAFGERARQDVRQRFTWDRTARLTYRYYRNLIGDDVPSL